MKKTTYRHDWENGYTKVRRLSRSFETLEKAEKFAEGKQLIDIYKSKGKYKVEYKKLLIIIKVLRFHQGYKFKL